MPLAAIVLCGFCPFLAVYVTQPLLPLLSMAFNTSHAAASLTVTATTLAIAATAPFIGILADLSGRKLVIVIAIFGLAVPTALAATASTMTELIVWRFIQGMFVPGIFSVALAYIAEEWEGPRRASAASAYVAGNVFGSVSGRVVAGLGAAYMGWQSAFVAISLLLLCGGALVWVFLPPSRRFERQSSVCVGLRSIAIHLRNPPFLAVCVIGFNTLLVFVGVFTYITFRLSAAPFAMGSAALALLFLLNLFGAIATRSRADGWIATAPERA